MRPMLALLCLPLAACGSTSGTTVAAHGSGATRSYPVQGFTQVALGGPDTVTVRTGPSFAVQAVGEPAVLDDLEVRKDGDTLRIRRRDRLTGMHQEARITVTLPRLTGASVGGSGTMDVDRATGDFSGAVGGSGDLRVARLDGGTASLSVGGSGTLRTAGSADRLHASIAGSGGLDASGLNVRDADLSIAGSGTVKAHVAGDAHVSIVGSGDAVIRGGARCQVNKLGSGNVDCG